MHELKTYNELYHWLFEYQIPDKVARNKLAMKRWEKAISMPTLGNIYSFYHCAGLTEPKIIWNEIK